MANTETPEEKQIREAHIQRNTRLAKSISQKIDALGIKRLHTASMAINLSNLYISFEEYNDYLDVILKANRARLEIIVYGITDIRALFQEMSRCIQSGRTQFKRIIDHCPSTNSERTSEENKASFQPAKINNRLADRLEAKILLLEMFRVRADIGLLLATIYSGLERHIELVNEFLTTDSRDSAAIGTILIEIRDNLEETYKYIKTARRILYWVEVYCYEDEEE